MQLHLACFSSNISCPKECTFTIFQLLTACIAFGYHVVIRPVHGPVQRARRFPQANLSSDIPDLDAAHTPSQVPRSLYQCFACPSPHSATGAFSCFISLQMCIGWLRIGWLCIHTLASIK